MKHIVDVCAQLQSERDDTRPVRHRLFPILLAAMLLAMTQAASAQVEPSGTAGGLSLSVGDTFSGFYLGYGARKMGGLSTFVDLDTPHHWGLEGEARWLVIHRTQGAQASTYLFGPRYYRNVGTRFQPFAKGTIGVGLFTFPNSMGHGSYFVVAPGAGVDYLLTRNLHLRLAEVEYQYWNQFPFGNMSAVGVSTGFRYTLF